MTTDLRYNGQAAQDYFILKCLNFKKSGTFLEIGSNHPININNTYILEKDYGWNGLMVECETSYLPSYKIHRPNSIYAMQDAVLVDYKDIFKTNNFPTNMDYLQIDLEVTTKSTISVLEKLNSDIMNDYKFAVVTFEHDIYRGDFYNTRSRSREIFNNRGYLRVFSDVNDSCDNSADFRFEDWYVYPELVNMDYINKLPITDNSLYWEDIIKILDSVV